MSEGNIFRRLLPERMKTDELVLRQGAQVKTIPADTTEQEEQGLLNLSKNDRAEVKERYSKWLPTEVYSLEENIELDPNYLIKALADTLINLSWAYDSLDHVTSPEAELVDHKLGTGAGTDAVQDACQQVRELASEIARSIPKTDTTS